MRLNIRANLKDYIRSFLEIYNKNRKSPNSINIFLESLHFLLSYNYWPNFKNPRSFNEFICSIKFYGNLEDLAYVSDKLRVMDKVKKEVGDKYLLKIYDVIDDPRNIDLEKYKTYPKSFVAKPNHASQRVFINNGESNFDLFRNSIQSFLDEYGNIPQEFHYKLIQPKIMIQELISPSDNKLFDFKFYVFKGRVELIWVRCNLLKNNDEGNYNAIIYTRDWKLSEFQRRPSINNNVEKPQCLDEMIYVAETLGRDWEFIRVDMYLYDNNIIKFGEMTPTPLAGRGAFYPPNADILLYQKFLKSS